MSNSLAPLILANQKPTHDSGSMIENIWTNINQNKFESDTFESYYSGHKRILNSGYTQETTHRRGVAIAISNKIASSNELRKYQKN